MRTFISNPRISILFLVLIFKCFRTSAQFIIEETNFENSFTFITYSPQSNNAWQVGPTNKTFFGSANTLPNSIMTDTINSYPVNCNNSFIIRVHNEFNWAGIPIQVHLEFDHKYQTASGQDGGVVEVSYDSISWQNILLDTFYINNNGCFPGSPPDLINFYSISDTINNGHPAFTGQSSGWVHSSAWWCWFITMAESAQQIPPDSMWIRFTFSSDSIFDNLDGWIVDNINLWGENPSAIPDIKIEAGKLNIFPQPSTGNFKIQITGDEIPVEYSILNVDGRQIKKGIIEIDFSVSAEDLKPGYYFIKVRTINNLELFHSLIIN